MSAPDPILARSYRLLGKLGQGGMASVWAAEDMTLRSTVAVKIMAPNIVSNPQAVARFTREARASATLRSPHIVHVTDYGVDQGLPFIVMELLDGESLAARLRRCGRLSPAEVTQILGQVARGVAKAHDAGVIHRDLKPDNVFLVPNDDELLVKVLDFGIAKTTQPDQSLGIAGTGVGAVLGTAFYMSPEQAEGLAEIDYRTDLWALGVIAYECLLGQRPFDGTSLGSIVLAVCSRPPPIPSQKGVVPPGFDAWFARACARETALRFQSAKELASALRLVCGGAQISTVGDRSERDPDVPRSAKTPTPALVATPAFARSEAPFSATRESGVRGHFSRKNLAVGGALLALVAGLGTLAAVFRGARHYDETATERAERSRAAGEAALANPAPNPLAPLEEASSNPMLSPSGQAIRPAVVDAMPAPSQGPTEPSNMPAPSAVPPVRNGVSPAQAQVPQKPRPAPAPTPARPSPRPVTKPQPAGTARPVDLGI